VIEILRILHVVNKMDRGGIETLLMSIYRNVDRNKIQFDFLVSKYDEGEYDKEILQLGGKIYRVRSRREGVLNNKSDLNQFFRENNYQIVHVHVSSMTNIQSIKSAKKNKVSTRIIHCHNTKGPRGLMHELMHRYNRLIIDRYCTDKFACSTDAAVWGFGKKKISNKKINIFNNAINTTKFVYKDEVRKEKRKELGVEDSFIIGHVGRFVEQKNHGFIIKIFNELIKIEKKAKLLLVGVGRLEEEIKKQIEELGIEKSVMMLGSRSDVNELMQAMDVFLFPSLFEGLGIVAIEAQAADLHVFASDVVPKEANISELFHSLSLNDEPLKWAEKIVKYSKINARVDRTGDIIKNNYDIKANTEWITNFYLNHAKN
jgi:glycosyltransferase involved in cell wall biosynthesis